MANHPNYGRVYRIQILDGRFDHVATKKAAIMRAIEMVGADPGATAKALEHNWGVSITRVSAAMARSVGL
jgi:hypothetical protein